MFRINIVKITLMTIIASTTLYLNHANNHHVNNNIHSNNNSIYCNNNSIYCNIKINNSNKLNMNKDPTPRAKT